MSAASDVLRVAGIVNDSIVDGPGMRLTVFVQGCPHGCPGCHNPQTHDFHGGYEESIQAIIEKVRSNPLLSGVTLSGGEPFCQAGALANVAKECHALGLNVWTYTGYTFEKLLEGLEAHPGWRELLLETDVLVDGPFILAEKSLDCRWRGSRNQRLLDARASLEAGKAVETGL